MKRETIKQTLGKYIELDKEQLDELTDSLLNSFHEELDNQKQETNNQIKELEAKTNELEQANKTIKNLQKNLKDPEEVAKEIASYEETISGLREKLHNQEISAYEQSKLTAAGAQDIGICQLALDYDKSLIKSKDDYKIIDEAIENQRKNKAFLFKHEEQTVKAPYNPRVGKGRLDVEDSTGKDFAKMLAKERDGFMIKGVQN